MLGVTAGAQETEERCKNNDISATGKATLLGKWRARQLSITAWQLEVRRKFGERYLDFAKAKDVSFDCGPTGAGVSGNLLKRCTVRATPCREVVAEGDGDRGFGESDEERRVSYIQRLLARAGYLRSDQVDGEYGGATQRAVRRFQVDNDLRVTGEVDERTMRRLRGRSRQGPWNQHHRSPCDVQHATSIPALSTAHRPPTRTRARRA
jgi:hypothetical protein